MKQSRIGRALGVSLLAAAIMATAVPAGAKGHAETDPTVRRQLAALRSATVDFKSVSAAEAAGYVEFLDCFDSPAGGMGQHYVDLGALDGEVNANQPEAMVYEVKGHSLKLVGVEYIVPGDFVDPANPPALFGQDFHLNEALGVWVLHAWVWKANPAGIFEDFNPNVPACP
jgi:hypothetical protein